MARMWRVKQPLVLRVADVAVLMDCDEETVRRAIRAGRLPGFRIGREWRIPKDVLERLLEQQGAAQGNAGGAL